MDVFEMLDEMEEIIESSSRIPLTRKVMVDADEFLDCIDQIRSILPEEIRQARWVAKEKERMLADAQQEAEQALKKTQVQIEQMALDTEIVRIAEQKAEEILSKARAIGMEMCEGATIYSEQILEQLERNLDKALDSIREGRAELQNSKTNVS